MINRIAPVGLVLAIACGGGGGDIIPPPPPPPTPTDISTMAVGEVRTYLPAEIANGLDLPTVTAARDYVIIVGNTSTVHDAVANYTVRADRDPGAALEISAPEQASQAVSVIDRIPLARTPQAALDNTVRGFERRNLTLRQSSDPSGSSRFTLRRSVQAGAAAVPAVGDKIPIKIPDANTNNLCNNYISTLAEVASVSTRAILVVDTLDGPPALLFTQAQMDSITSEFDAITYPTDVGYFGTPTDLDNNNGHIILLFTGQVNLLTPPNTSGGFVAGFFFAGDFFPTTGTQPGTFCPQSNVAEIFYLLSPDPTAKFGNVRTTSSVRQGTRGTIAHEFQHMINAGNRFINPAVNDFEVTWLDEALAHMAEDAVGRTQRGFTDLRTLTFSDVLPCNSPCAEANDFNAFFFQNLARLTSWMDKPNLYSPTSALADTSLATRGAAWAFVRYGADNYSNSNPRAFTRALVAGPDTGISNFARVANAPRDTLTKGWLVAMYTDHFGVSGLNPKYEYRSWNFRSVMPPVAQSVLSQPAPRYPLAVRSIGSGTDIVAATNRSGSGTYYRLAVAANSAARNVKVTDAAGANANFGGEHIYVIRVQ